MIRNHSGHSAEVEMYVVQNGSRFRIAQLGPDFLVLENADDIDGPVDITLSVDGATRSRHVQLQRGTTQGHKKIISRAE